MGQWSSQVPRLSSSSGLPRSHKACQGSRNSGLTKMAIEKARVEWNNYWKTGIYIYILYMCIYIIVYTYVYIYDTIDTRSATPSLFLSLSLPLRLSTYNIISYHIICTVFICIIHINRIFWLPSCCAQTHPLFGGNQVPKWDSTTGGWVTPWKICESQFRPSFHFWHGNEKWFKAPTKQESCSAIHVTRMVRS